MQSCWISFHGWSTPVSLFAAMTATAPMDSDESNACTSEIRTTPLLSVVMGLMLVERMALLYRRQASAAAWMRNELARQQLALERSFEGLQRQREAELQAQARLRITRELHDGLGSHLVAAAALLGRPQPQAGDRAALATLIDQSLQELRSALDAIGSGQADLAELLGALRDRLEPVLDARGIELDWVGVPVGGGGLLAGTGFAVARWNEQRGTSVRVFAGEPSGADDAARGLASGKIEHNADPQTVCDGMRTELGSINFPIILATVAAIHTLDDPEILAAQRIIADRLKIIVETNCAPPLAAVVKQAGVFKGQRVGIILSGGNLDLSTHQWGPAL